MSTSSNVLQNATTTAEEAPKGQAPLLAPTGDAPVDVLLGDVNQMASPFQRLAALDGAPLDLANDLIGGILGAMSGVETLLNDGFALATAKIAAIFPPLPAATLGMLHLGFPHLHAHPPALFVPLPSMGPVALAGCASVLVNGVPAARAGDLGIGLICGSLAPPFEVFTGSSKVFFGGARAARMLDITKHCQPGDAAAKAMSAFDKVMGAVAIGAEALNVAATAARPIEKTDPEAEAEAREDKAAQVKMGAIQAGLDAAAMALTAIMGMDPGAPPCFGALLTGMPNVLIGGFPMPPWSAVARGLGKLAKGLKKRAPRVFAKLECMFTGHPIDPVTGANVDSFVDYEDPESVIGFRWGRRYTSADADRRGPMGRGFRHSYERSLHIDLDTIVYTDENGKTFPFPPIGPGEPAAAREGHVLTVRREGRALVYSVARGREPTVEFARREWQHVTLPPRRLVAERGRAELSYDALGRLSTMVETGGARFAETRFSYDAEGHLVEVRRGSVQGGSPQVIASYAFDHLGCLTAFRDALGARATYAYDRRQRVILMRDRNGYGFHFTYDDEGRCVEEHGEDGLWRVSMRYEPERRRTLATEADGGVWIYEYDEHGTLVARTDPYGGTVSWELDQDGRLLREIGPDGRPQLTFLYDETGQNHAVIDRFGHVQRPLDEEPNPPDPRALRVPGAARERQWGPLAGELPLSSAVIPPEAWERSDDAVSSDVVSTRWDACGRLIDAVDAQGLRRTWALDANGNETRYVDRDGRERRAAITSWNLVAEDIDPLGQTTRYEHTPHERVARIIDPGGSECRYEYDLKDRLVKVLRCGEAFEEYRYDRCDRVVERRDGAGNLLISRSFGRDGLESARRLSSGSLIRYDHDARGRITRAAADGHEVRRAFDARGRLLFDERDDLGVLHRFDVEGVEETRSLGRFRVVRRREPDGALCLYTPDGRAHRIRRVEARSVLATLGNGTSALTRYDEAGRCVGSTVWRRRGDKLALLRTRCTYSPEGELRRIDDGARGVIDYRYDLAHRVIGEVGPLGSRDIVLDGAGNVLHKHGLGRVTVRDGNRLQSAGRERFEYDGRDRLSVHVAEDDSVTRYRYDSLDRLVEVSWSGRSEVWTAAYDGLGRRIAKALGKARTRFYWDEHRLAAEIGPSGALRLYVYPGPEALVPLLFIDYPSIEAAPESGRTYYPFANQVGAPSHIEDNEGRVVWRAEHIDPYGAVTLAEGASVAYGPRFPGHYADEETGLHYNRFRDYSPRLGRYLQPDPIGQSGGVNLYAYVSNPLVDVDVLGLNGDGHNKKRKSSADPDHDLAVALAGESRRKSARVQRRDEARREAILGSVPSDGTWQSSTHYTGREHELHHNKFPEVRKEIKAKLGAQMGDAGVDAPPHIIAAAKKAHDERGSNDFVEHVPDAQGRTVLAYGKIVGRQNKGKGTTPDPPNNSRIVGMDDRGHLVAEDAVNADPNVTGNIIAENAVINQQYKTPFEEFTKDYATEHPAQDVYTMHEPIYNGSEVRPTKVNHFILVDGEVKASLTLQNPDDLKMPGH